MEDCHLARYLSFTDNEKTQIPGHPENTMIGNLHVSTRYH